MLLHLPPKQYTDPFKGFLEIMHIDCGMTGRNSRSYQLTSLQCPNLKCVSLLD